MAIPITSKQLRSLVDQNQSLAKKQFCISETLHKEPKKPPQTIIVCVLLALDIKISSARSIVWFELFCMGLCMFTMYSKLNCFKNGSFRHGRLLSIFFFHYKSDYPYISITVGLALVL